MTRLGKWSERFSEIWSVDFEYRRGPTAPSDIICMVAQEIFSNQIIRIAAHSVQSSHWPLFLENKTALVISYNISAEAQCFEVLNWPQPKWFLDLMPEYLNQTNNLKRPYGIGLVGCLAHLEVPFMTTQRKELIRDKILSKNDLSEENLTEILDYCEEDVSGCAQGFVKLASRIEIDHALLRSKSVLALWQVMKNRVHVNQQWLSAFQENCDLIRDRLIAKINPQYQVYEDAVFKQSKFTKYLERQNISWPLTQNGHLDLREETFKEMAVTCPQITPLKDLKKVIAQLRLEPLRIDSNSRVSADCFPFGTITGRFQPLPSRNIFGRGSWLKNIITPPSEDTVYYEIDIKQEEFGVAAVLSKDAKMLAAYEDGDCYLSFGKQAGLVPPDATPVSHPAERERFKQSVLSQNYLQSAAGLAKKLNISTAESSFLISKYRDNFSTYWRWSEALRDVAYSQGYIDTVFGWRLHITDETSERTIANFPMQGNSSELLRLALILMTENGLKLCAVNHDAFLLECPTNDFNQLNLALDCIKSASRSVLNGFELQYDIKEIRHHKPLNAKKGLDMWLKINQIMVEEKILPVP